MRVCGVSGHKFAFNFLQCREPIIESRLQHILIVSILSYLGVDKFTYFVKFFIGEVFGVDLYHCALDTAVSYTLYFTFARVFCVLNMSITCGKISWAYQKGEITLPTVVRWHTVNLQPEVGVIVTVLCRIGSRQV